MRYPPSHECLPSLSLTSASKPSEQAPAALSSPLFSYPEQAHGSHLTTGDNTKDKAGARDDASCATRLDEKRSNDEVPKSGNQEMTAEGVDQDEKRSKCEVPKSGNQEMTARLR